MKKSYKTPPCSKWSPPAHQQYRSKTGKLLCRKKAVRQTRKVRPSTSIARAVRLHTTREKSISRNEPNPFVSCPQSSPEELKEWSRLLKTTPENVCNKLETIYFRGSPSNDMVFQVCELLGIKYETSNNREQLLTLIYNHVSQYSKGDWNTWMKWMKGVNKTVVSEWIVNLLFEIALKRIENIHAPLTKPEYNRLLNLYVQQKKDGIIRLTENQEEMLNETLHGKMCSCIKKVKMSDYLSENFSNLKKRSTPANPYAVCTASLYNKRGLTAPSNAARECVKYDI